MKYWYTMMIGTPQGPKYTPAAKINPDLPLEGDNIEFYGKSFWRIVEADEIVDELNVPWFEAKKAERERAAAEPKESEDEPDEATEPAEKETDSLWARAQAKADREAAHEKVRSILDAWERSAAANRELMAKSDAPTVDADWEWDIDDIFTVPPLTLPEFGEPVTLGDKIAEIMAG